MNSKLDFGLPPLDFARIAADTLREVRHILATEPDSLRGMFFAVMWEAARVTWPERAPGRQIIETFLTVTQTYEPSPEDVYLAARMHLAVFHRPDLLVPLSPPTIPSERVLPRGRSIPCDANGSAGT
jgi:hypothetical protein